MSTEECVGIKEEGLLGCKQREKRTASKKEALVINARGTMTTSTLGNGYVLSKRRVAGY